MNNTILVTGGTGYIGSHTVIELLNAGANVIVFDNLSNSKRSVIDKINMITGKSPFFIKGDIRNNEDLRRIFQSYEISSVIHFAGVKAVGESVINPLKYYDNNVIGTLVLLDEMSRAKVNKIVFSSSATVYGDPESVPINENSLLRPTNPYGQSKLVVENILRDLQTGFPEWKIILLRYFNPVGAHSSGLIGEDPFDTPNNLMPIIAQVAVGIRKKLFVYGNDYPTQDGTGVRDYIHVEDLAVGHIAALQALDEHAGVTAINLGTGQPYSVLEMISSYERASRQMIAYEIVARRPGDIAVCYADTTKADKLLRWQARHSLQKMCQDSWNFVRMLNAIKC